ncbi:glycine dehydrogenase [Serratia quinivorans]|uniref:glycine dehydrogenase n=1 Tax=Serratia quinivorans TaxID=137545 RepID=UPI00217BB056|nr:glycine dehydrogenase [Serratia quinivorans]CAI1021078.1 PRD domain protein, EF_0829/AHA_3910 family [Serratia quinivorans]CAI1022421.1 PRD domain protein, EF_0829/AHA_3910 family [Serratia quinivorans]CAI1888045.1 PRD domain protein, EF_0829/AHA_3910 family [Serratia quinivorans]CAI2117355.1 PRD domain protein, EF_0829/AHA_3910 family [Serratia quinivorans]CAI2150343.1 PRD domain protein, EF_0829/AHA_3910 family [Serratia quinivorans]
MNDGSVAIENSEQPDVSLAGTITEQVLAGITEMLNAEGIYTNAVQQQMLESHIRAMVLRSITGEPLPEVDKSLFDEISAESMQMAERVVGQFAILPIEEAYLLSVHFEVAKDNNQ